MSAVSSHRVCGNRHRKLIQSAHSLGIVPFQGSQGEANVTPGLGTTGMGHRGSVSPGIFPQLRAYVLFAIL